MAAKVKRLILLPSPKLRPRGKEVLCCFTSAITYIIAILSALSLQLHAAPGAIKSDAEVQGLPCDGVCRQGKPCTPGVISGIVGFVCITFNRTPQHLNLNKVYDMRRPHPKAVEFKFLSSCISAAGPTS